MASVSLDHITKQYPNGVQALQDICLHATDGELLALVGPSGCGKTTLLRIIAGLETPTSGRVQIGDRDVTSCPAYRRDVAMVFQRPTLYPHLNVRSNLTFGLDARQLFHWFRTDPARDALVADTAGILGLTDLLERRPAELSGGQQQRVALGRAIVRHPAVFLLDEPLSNLDSRLRLEMRRELHLLHKRLRATMFYVTHDQEEALTLGDRVAVLREGQVQQTDRPDALYERPANCFVAGFLGWPGMNLLDGRLVAEHDGLRLENGPDVFHLGSVRQGEWRSFAGRRVTLGIRPEHVRLVPPPHPPPQGGREQDRPPQGGREQDCPSPLVGEGRVGGRAEATLALEVRLVEALGPDRLLTLRHGDWTVSMRLEKSLAPVEQTTVTAAFALTRAHLFDQENGRALSHGRPDG
jgi:multiple sugar transport system ATP-binding protein